MEIRGVFAFDMESLIDLINGSIDHKTESIVDIKYSTVLDGDGDVEYSALIFVVKK